MDNPCNDCLYRAMYARIFDMHFCGADCPYECNEYERYLKERIKDEGDSGNSYGSTDGEL